MKTLFSQFLADQQIISQTDAYQTNITAYEPKGEIRTVLKPQNTAEVQKIVQVANEHTIALFPFGAGRNWGLGSKVPVSQTVSAWVDLGGLNTLELNEELGYIVIGAGITQKQVADFLKDTPYMIPMTGSGNRTSVVGNLLERGATFYFPRQNLVLAWEVVLGNGKIIRTGHWHFPDAKLCHASGVGADLNGLFTQSNFGITTQVVLRLLPKSTPTVVYLETFEENLLECIKKLHNLCQDKVLDEFVLITNKNDPRTTTQRKYDYTGEWVMVGFISGTDRIRQASKTDLEETMQEITHKIQYIEQDMPDDQLDHQYFRVLRRLAQGVPSNYSLETMAEIYGIVLDTENDNIDYYPQIPGFSVVPLAVPFESKAIKLVIDTVNQVSEKMGVQAFHNFASLSPTSMEGYYRIYFDRNDPQAINQAHQWNKALSEALAQVGIYPYRLNNQ